MQRKIKEKFAIMHEMKRGLFKLKLVISSFLRSQIPQVVILPLFQCHCGFRQMHTSRTTHTHKFIEQFRMFLEATILLVLSLARIT
jgi:hypothetical protein